MSEYINLLPKHLYSMPTKYSIEYRCNTKQSVDLTQQHKKNIKGGFENENQL